MIDYKILNFPTFPISKQLFVASGQAIDGGMTAGGVRMLSPEPGGRSMLELQPSLQVNEWDYPLSSWLMSKVNGDIFRVRLAPTPQVAGSRVAASQFKNGIPWDSDQPWSNQRNWDGDATASFVTPALEGSNTVVIETKAIKSILRNGHVIGHGDVTYMIDDIQYNGSLATITVNPPFRKKINPNDIALVRPFFLGSIANGDEMRISYDAENNGNIQLGVIRLNEVIL